MAERRETAGDVAFLLEPDLKESHGGLRDVSVLRAISAYAPLLADYADLASLDERDGTVHRHQGRAAPHGPARARQAAAAGPGPGGGRTRLRRCGRAHARRLDGGSPDRLGQRRRVAAAAAVGSHAPAEAPLPPRHRRRAPRPAAGGPRARHGRSRRRDRAHPDWPRCRTTPPCPCAWPPRRPNSTGPSPRARCTGWPTACPRRATRGRPRPATPSSTLLGLRPAGHRQDRVAGPARPAGAADPRVGRRAQQAAAQRLPHLHRGPASARGRRTGRRADRHGRTARPAAGRDPAARHRQGLPRRPHRRSAWRWSTASATRMGFAPADVAVLVDLVRYHLLLPDTATRRDLDDPTTIARVARAAGDRLHPASARRPHRGGQPGDGALGLGGLEGGPRRRPRRADRPRASGRDRAGRAGPHPGGEPGADGRGARHRACRRSRCSRPR